MNRQKITIAIDGPAASGKSTTARIIAKKLGYLYIDSGAMYRAVTLAAIRSNIPVADQVKVAEIARNITIQFRKNDQKTIIFLNDEDISDDIRTPQIDQQISPVAANPEVRKILVERQREMGRHGGVVMDGRDIGTVVFPNAELKIFMLATVEERAKRRLREQQANSKSLDIEKIKDDIRYRDKQDENRNHGPLKKSDDAILIDTTKLSIEQQVNEILKLAGEKIKMDSDKKKS